MATTIQTVIDSLVRPTLNELAQITDGFWTDAQLMAWMQAGAKDLWRAINDLQNQDYFLTIDTTNVTQASGLSQLSGVPADVGIVRGIEPVDMDAYPSLFYETQPYNSVKFQRSRRRGTVEPGSAGTINYAVTGAGGPVAAPIIRVAPILSATVALRVSYAPTLAALTLVGSNPIPGESDNALAAWTIAYALGKESEDRIPDAGWLSIYGNEKQNLLVSLTPRADEDDTVAEALFEDEWQ